MIQKLRTIEFQHRLARIFRAYKQEVARGGKEKERLHIVYVMTHVGISGGVKIIFEHANRLKQLGAKVTIVAHYMKPSWFPIEADYVQVPFGLELAKGIPDCDLIVATYWDHIQACIETGIAPVVYFEQGDFHLFDYGKMNQTLKNYIHIQYQIPPFIYTVSRPAAELIEKLYGREAKVYPNAIDETVFNPEGPKVTGDRPYLLMIGRESTAFKGLSYILDAYDMLKKEFELDLYWITPETPSEKMKQRATKCFISPSQETIASLYRGAALYVSGSTYESFSLPPLEAMACGCPVVTTDNEGVLEYAVHLENAMICRMRDPQDMAEKISELLSNPDLKERLIRNGLETAGRYNWIAIMKEILDYYSDIALYQVQPRNLLTDWDIRIRREHCLHPEDYVRFEKFLLATKSDLVKVPVIYEIDKVPVIARWETAAVRKKIDNGLVETCYCPVHPANGLALYNLKGYQSFLLKEFDKALDEFLELQETSEAKEQAVYGKWAVLTLMRLQRKEEAKRKLKALMDEHPYYPDLYKLALLLEGKNQHHINSIRVLGDGAAYPEFFYQIDSII
ncbi:glycosyltransferase family 4 protein [Ureibacillus sp. FSL K6-8385]|uniref:Glycosyltransferase family 4 protein n=1 Tax=Ureibacillus terrenus TaxID=118246 RepID=A0A540V4Q6_9BACL|nr:glycosyltransferase family 4 protein [Ureibacillus terrenus]MED3662751.1 glycosyltransferase family 4 protein [Ureibacillus terrenus]MED3763697.1 glycosyltransferase family 4 protein [Ureibacillus terrenus]TQE91173.1 glycosyltransferase family 4 protein [Ureibacillus terrenus]